MKQEGLLVLTAKARRRVQSCLINLVRSKGGGGQIGHEVLLLRCLFLLLIHSKFADILEIKKQKQNGSQFIHDLTITTQTETLFIEVDSGKEPTQTLQSKINGFQSCQEGTLIYFTNSFKTYSQFGHSPQVQFIYLKSQTLREDILGLTSKVQGRPNITSQLQADSNASNVFLDPSLNSSFQNKSGSQDVFNKDNLLYYDKPVIESDLSQNLEERRSDLIKLLLGDY